MVPNLQSRTPPRAILKTSGGGEWDGTWGKIIIIKRDWGWEPLLCRLDKETLQQSSWPQLILSLLLTMMANLWHIKNNGYKQFNKWTIKGINSRSEESRWQRIGFKKRTGRFSYGQEARSRPASMGIKRYLKLAGGRLLLWKLWTLGSETEQGWVDTSRYIVPAC